MAAVAPPVLDDVLWTVAAARLCLGSSMSVQCPPNLTPRLPRAAAAAEGDAAAAAGARDSTDDAWIRPFLPAPLPAGRFPGS